MKKVLATLLLVFAISFSYAQGKSVQKMAESNTKEMVKVLSLDDTQAASILKINLEKNTKLDANKTNQSLTTEEKKANRKAIYKEAQVAFRELLGNQVIKKWNTFKNAQTAKKKMKH